MSTYSMLFAEALPAVKPIQAPVTATKTLADEAMSVKGGVLTAR